MQTFWLFIFTTLAYSSAQRCVEDQVSVQRAIKLTCKNGFYQPSACIVSDQNGPVELQINSSKVVDGFWIKCEMDGNSIRYSKEPRCIVDGKQYHINDTLKTSNVVYKCLGTSIEPLGCYFLDSKNQEVNVKLGQTVLLDNIQHRCRPGGVEDSSLKTSCVVNGTTRQVGDKWDGGRGFIQECTSDGYITVSECVVEPGVSVKIGQTLVHKKYLHSCIKNGVGVRYTAEPCGVAGVVCPGDASNQNGSATNNNNNPVDCLIDGHKLKTGDKYPSSDKGFTFQCSPDGSMVISDCTIEAGLSVAVGKSVAYKNRLHKCVRNGDKVQYIAEPCGPTVDCSSSGGGESSVNKGGSSCQKDGIKHESGQIWTEKQFKLECKDGAVSVKSCIADDNTEILVGGTYRLGKSKFVCQQKPGGKGVTLTVETCQGNDC